VAAVVAARSGAGAASGGGAAGAGGSASAGRLGHAGRGAPPRRVTPRQVRPPPLTVFSGGVPGLYRAFAGAVVGAVPAALLYFWTYDEVHRRAERAELSAPLAHIAAACAGAAASAVARVPSDILKHRVQAFQHPDVAAAARAVLRRSGLSGFYAGAGPTLLRDMPEICIQFAIYSELSPRVAAYFGAGDAASGALQHMAVGGLAGALAAAATTPIDAVKTALQCGQCRRGATACVRQIVRARGVGGLFAGIGPRLMQASAMSATFFVAFEQLQAVLEGRAGDAAGAAVEEEDEPADLFASAAPVQRLA